VRRPSGARSEHEDLSKTSILATIEASRGRAGQVHGADRGAALAPGRIAELLQIRPRSPILCFERTYFAVAGEAVEYAITYQACRRYPYRVTFSRPERAERRS